MISALCWAPREAVKTLPVKFEMTAEEIQEAKRLAELERVGDGEIGGEEDESMGLGDDEEEEQESLEPSTKEPELDSDGLPKSLRMDSYDDENAKEGALALSSTTGLREEMDMNEIKVENDKLVEELGDDDDLGSDAEAYEIKESDRVIIVASTGEDVSCLEVQIYDDSSGAFYVHHDIALSAFPLCITWTGCDASMLGGATSTDSRNYIAVGTFNPEIEIWNLDVIDIVEPNITLGKKGKPGSHSDAVMGLDWNSTHRHLIVSGSADKTVKLWDISQQTCVHTFDHHSDKVQSVAWNPVETSIVLTGSFDRSIAVFDAREGSAAKRARFEIDADVECAEWNPHRPAEFVVSSEDGKVSCFDVRRPGKDPLYAFQAHQEPCSAVSFSLRVQGLLATCSPEKCVKIWDTNNSAASPKLVCSKTMSIGAIFDCAFSIDDPFILAAGGDKGLLAIWDIQGEANVKQLFSNRVVEKPSVQERHLEESGDGASDPTQPTTEQQPGTEAKKNVDRDDFKADANASSVKRKKKKNRNKRKSAK